MQTIHMELKRDLINQIKQDYSNARTLISELKSDYNGARTLLNELKADYNNTGHYYKRAEI